MHASNPARAAGWVAVCFTVSAITAIGVGAVWWRHGSTQLAGLLLATSLATLAGGLATWANRMTPQGPYAEERPDPAQPRASASGAADLATGSALPRRGLVLGSLTGAAVTLGAALAVPFGSLGPRPRGALLRTGWGPGRRAVDSNNNTVDAAAIPLGGIVTVFPEGQAGSADGQVVLVRVEPSLLDLPEGRAGWAPEGLVAYSKVCTHAGCPVGLFSTETNELLCPCHQSAFDVLRGAEPTNGPAAWPLPQLPLRINSRGLVVADGTLSAPVGPGWWKVDRP